MDSAPHHIPRRSWRSNDNNALRPRRVRRRTPHLLASATAGVLTALVASGPADAQKLGQWEWADEFAFDRTDICGTDLDVHFQVLAEGRGRLIQQGDDPLDVIVQFNERIAATLTAIDSGKTMTIRANVLTQDRTVEDLGGGLIEVETLAAAHWEYRDSDGKVAATNAGTLRTVLVIDLNGTPLDDSDDTVVSSEVVAVTGLEESSRDDTCPITLELLG